MLSLAAAPKLSDNSRRGLRTNGSGARQVRRPEPMSCELDPLFGRDTANDMIWPDRQKDRAAFDPSLLSRLCVRSADAVKNDWACPRRHIAAGQDRCGRCGSQNLNPRKQRPQLSAQPQRSIPTAMLRPVNSAKVDVCAHNFANASSFATASCTFPYTSQLE
jgi:hypothetical protein